MIHVKGEDMAYKLPPVLYNAEGLIRKAGFEIEFTDIHINTVNEIIKTSYGGEIQKKGSFDYEIANTRLGDFKVKLDTSLFKHPHYQKIVSNLSESARDIVKSEHPLEEKIHTSLGDLASTLVPYEIVTPALPVNELEKLEALRWALYENKAKGTSSSLMYAFATHVNAEAPHLNVFSMMNHLRAFLVLYPYIIHKQRINPARRISYFINPFQWKYLRIVLEPEYQEEMEQFMRTYYQYNPDRNRPLDLYPLFAHLRPALVNKFKNIGNVKSRPTYHYRLPNSLIDDKNWSFSEEWNMWVEIERLADDVPKLMDLCNRFLKLRKRSFWGFRRKWIKILEENR